MADILIIEDDRALSNGISLALKSESIGVCPCYSLASAQKALAEKNYDLMILDINLPDGNGLDFLKKIREQMDVPVIMLTANDLETDIVTGLEMGAQDYITKPFSLAILRARVHAQLRKPTLKNKFAQDEFVFDFDNLTFYKKGCLIELSKTEQKLLKAFIDNKGITLQREKLLDRIWTDGADYVDENALSVTVKRLRDKLEDTPSKPQYIKTIYGIGYSWAVKE